MTNHAHSAKKEYLSPAVAISLALVSYLMFTSGDTLAKWLQSGYGAAQILVIINAIGLVIMAGTAIRMRGLKKAFKSSKWRLHWIRGCVVATSTLCVFYALKTMLLSDFYGIVFLSPLWAALLSRIFFKEKIPPSRLVAIMVGFIGVLVIAGAGLASFNLGFMAALCTSFLGATGALLARHIGSDEAPTTFSITTHICMIVFNLPLTVTEWVPIQTADMSLMLLYGCLMAAALMLITIVFSRSQSVSQVAPLQYTQMLWGVLLGWLVFGNTPTTQTLAGSLLVIGAGLYIMQSLRRGRLMTR